MIDLSGKTAVVFGLANKRSIAWGIAQKLHEACANVAICYQNERMKLEAESLIQELPGATGFQCDVSNDDEIENVFAVIKEKYGKIDILVHAVAFAPASELRGDFINTSRDGFRVAKRVPEKVAVPDVVLQLYFGLRLSRYRSSASVEECEPDYRGKVSLR